ncbi:MAG: YegP family protein [Anaerolineales bacterium]
MAGKFALRKTEKGNFVFNLKAANGQIILTSQPYSDKHAALNGIESTRKNARDDGNFERCTSSDGRPYFLLKAANAQIIGQSEMYSSKASMENGISSVNRNAPSAPLQDLTEAD